MNNDEILSMPAGYEMDLLIAENLMGWKWFHYEEASYFRRNDVFDYVIIVDKIRGQTCVFNNSLPKFSADISSAWEVVEKLRSDNLSLGWRNRDFSITQMDRLEGGLWVAKTEKPSENSSGEICVNAETAPLAICRAALLAVVPAQQGGV